MPRKLEITLFASEAFGTGHHGTTRGCLLALDWILHRAPIRRVLDLGCGSGILAIAAAKAGAYVVGVDIDPAAAAASRLNARLNAISSRARFYAGDATKLRYGDHYDLVFANILMRPLLRARPATVRAGSRYLVLSGLLNHQAGSVRRTYHGGGWRCVHKFEIERWTTLILRRSGKTA